MPILKKGSRTDKSKIFASRLLNWWDPTNFDYPWRATSDPYKILVSEFLLRKTTRGQVKGIYEDFFRDYPTIEALCVADVESIESTIRPLGMQRIKAMWLKRLAETVVKEHNRRIPREKRLLERLPGVGTYIANAVLCLAYGDDVPLLDTNTVRVSGRVFSLRSSRKRAREDPKMWDAISMLIPRNKAKDFNLALLDFAASVCLMKNPKCAICPLLDICDYGPEYLRLQKKRFQPKVTINRKT